MQYGCVCGGGVWKGISTICEIYPQTKIVRLQYFWCIFYPHPFLCGIVLFREAPQEEKEEGGIDVFCCVFTLISSYQVRRRREKMMRSCSRKLEIWHGNS